MKPRHRKRLALLAQRARGGAEEPAVDLAVDPIEIAAHFDRIRLMFFIAQIATMRRIETGMRDGELKKSAGLENPPHLRQSAGLIGKIHHRHERDGKIK